MFDSREPFLGEGETSISLVGVNCRVPPIRPIFFGVAERFGVTVVEDSFFNLLGGFISGSGDSVSDLLLTGRSGGDEAGELASSLDGNLDNPPRPPSLPIRAAGFVGIGISSSESSDAVGVFSGSISGTCIGCIGGLLGNADDFAVIKAGGLVIAFGNGSVRRSDSNASLSELLFRTGLDERIAFTFAT